MNRDLHPLDQKGTPRYALNAVIESGEGDLGRISNELGHLDCAEIPFGKSIINYEALPGNRYVVFLKGEIDEIGVLDRCVYTTLFEDSCLSFGENLFSTYRVRGGCNTVVYFTDYKNPVRSITIENPPTTCDELNLTLGAKIPTLALEVLPQGGNLAVGSYTMALRYLDDNDNPTEWVAFSDLVNTLVTSTNYDDLSGLTGESNVSLELTIDKQDERYPYYQVAILPYTSGTGTPSQIKVSPRQKISSTRFVYTGNDTGYTTTTLDDLLIEGLKFQRAKYITQLDNRLVLAGVAERKEDWCKFQQFANQITTKYVTREESMKSPTSQGDLKNPSYGKSLGYMADEVYAYGIVYVLNDQTKSPVFSLPGRPPNAFDKEKLTVTLDFAGVGEVNEAEVKHLGLQLGQKVERWKVFNTSSGSGEMAYHEGTSVYPDTKDCNGDPVWGDLAGTPIRHHKFPSRKIVPHVSGDKLVHLGIEFSNIVYPSDDVVGHIIVRADRTEQNKTILDKGIFLEAWNADNIVSVGELKQDPKRLNNGNNVSLIGDTTAVMTPRLLGGDTLTSNYITLDYNLEYKGGPESYQYDVTGGVDDKVAIFAEVRKYDQGTSPAQSTNRNVETQVDLNTRFIKTIGGRTYRNASFTNRLQVLETADSFMSQKLLYGALKQDTVPYNVLEAIEYIPITQFTTETTVSCFSGDTFITELAVGNLLDSEGGLYNKGGFFGGVRPRLDILGSYLSSVYVESTVNFLPIDGTTNCERYYIPTQEHLNPDFDITILEYLLSLVSDFQADGSRSYVSPCQLRYSYALDFFVESRLPIYLPLDPTYNCCSGCLNEFNNRVVYSEVSFQEERSDPFRTFLANNYRDLEGDTGLVTQIKRWQDRLIIFTEENVWYLPAQVQERASEDGIISYVGTGSLFGITPKRMNTSKNAGCIDQRSIIETPVGLFFYDSKSGIPYLVNNQLQPINRGMFRWFKTARNGKIHAGFDEEYNRILLTSSGDSCKTDWTVSYNLLTKEWVSFHSYVPDMYMTGKKELILVSDKFYTANVGPYNVYEEGKKAPFVVEIIKTSEETRVWDSIEFYTEVEKDNVEDRWLTYNQMWVYNNYQSTGIIPLQPRNAQEGVDYLPNRVASSAVDVDRLDRNWSVNQLRSVVNKESAIYTENCNLTVGDIYPAQFTGQEWFNQESLRSKYLHIRYIFSILEDRKITHFYEKV